jgi:hypothetical protein
MADNLPISFPIPGESAIASYDWTDVANGLGYATFYGSLFSASHILTPTLFNVPNISLAAGTYVAFDATPFNSPRTAKGYAYINAHRLGGVGNTTFTAKVSKISGAVTTDISSEVNSSATGNDAWFLIRLLLTETVFKKGDIIRVSIKAADNTNFGISTTFPCLINIPFKIEL